MDKIKRNKTLITEQILAIFFLIIGLIFYISSKQISPGFQQVLGADAYPKAISILLILCSALAMILRARDHFTKKKEEQVEDSDALPVEWKKTAIRVLFIWILLIAYVGLLEVIGYFEASFLFLVFSMFVLGEQTKMWILKAIGISAAATMVIYLIFGKLLNIYLPDGIFF